MQLQLNPPTRYIRQGLKNEIAPAWYPVCHIVYNRDAWVKLMRLPTDMSFDEALLLCQESKDVWLAWVPDFGEIRLNRNEFYC
jgi:hypothetical protein